MKYLIFMFALALSPAHAERSFERLSCDLRVRDQGQTSLCWLHTGVQMIEMLTRFPISIDALLIPEIRSRALARYLGHDTPWDGGAGPTRPFALALEHGVVPEEIWNRDSVLVRNYARVFAKIEQLLTQRMNQNQFMEAVDQVILSFTGTLPPDVLADRAMDNVFGGRVSLSYDFRDVSYDDSIYGRMGEMAWTTIISRAGELKSIRSVIEKQVVRTDAKRAWQQAVNLFRAGRPVAFTMIWADHLGKTVLRVNSKNEYVAVRPSPVGTYQSSHLILITGLILENNEVVGLEVLDPLVSDPNRAIRIVTKPFFFTQGKTVHTLDFCENDLT